MITDLPTDFTTLHNYLKDRAIPTDDLNMRRAGLEYAGPDRIAEILGYRPRRGKIGIAIHYPGTDYTQIRMVPGGPIAPKGQTPHAYLPPHTDWDTVSGVLYICESALKALTLARVGLNALACGGVDTVYMTRKRAWAVGFPHAAIERGAIKEVRVAFDSDIDTNHNVTRAMNRLTAALIERHTDLTVTIQVLPPPHADGTGKWGLDDAAAAWGDQAIREWAEAAEYTRAPEEDDISRHLRELNDAWVFNREDSRAWSLERPGQSASYNEFKTGQEGHRIVQAETTSINVADRWFKWEHKTAVLGHTYHPGGDQIEDDRLNTWHDDGVQGAPGSVDPWLGLIRACVHDPETRDLMLKCMAYQVQMRGIQRLHKVLYFCGREQGTGKSTMAKIMERVLGQSNTGRITAKQMESDFNAVWATKELVVLDDPAKLRKDTWPMVKNMVTEDRCTINAKHKQERAADLWGVFYITANEADILNMDPNERRVLLIPFEPRDLHRDNDDKYWQEFFDWLDHEGGIDAIAHYLRTMDLTGFDPEFYPPMTAEKQQAIDAGLPDELAWLQEFTDDPYSFVPKERKIITGNELFMLYLGRAPMPNETGAARAFGAMINKKFMLPKAIPGGKRIKVNGKLANVYWVEQGQAPSAEWLLGGATTHINKYSIEV